MSEGFKKNIIDARDVFIRMRLEHIIHSINHLASATNHKPKSPAHLSADIDEFIKLCKDIDDFFVLKFDSSTYFYEYALKCKYKFEKSDTANLIDAQTNFLHIPFNKVCRLLTYYMDGFDKIISGFMDI